MAKTSEKVRGRGLPGPSFYPLAVLVIVVILLAAHDLSVGHLHWHDVWLGRAGTSLVALLIGSMSALTARQQYTATNKPYLTMARVEKSDKESAIDASADGYWQVKVTNAGKGLATIKDVRHTVQFVGDSEPIVGLKNEELHAVINKRPGFEGRTWYFGLWRKGSGVKEGDGRLLWEFPMGLAERIVKLDSTITYASSGGDKYWFKVICIPPHGIRAYV